MVVFYKIWKKYNEIQLTKTKWIWTIQKWKIMDPPQLSFIKSFNLLHLAITFLSQHKLYADSMDIIHCAAVMINACNNKKVTNTLQYITDSDHINY